MITTFLLVLAPIMSEFRSPHKSDCPMSFAYNNAQSPLLDIAINRGSTIIVSGYVWRGCINERDPYYYRQCSPDQ